MKTRPCAPGKINAPPRLTSQNISPAPFRLFLMRGESFKSTDWKKKKRRNIELGSGFGRFLAAKIEFSYGAGQTVNLLALALRLQWFESTPTQASPRTILQVFKPFGGQLGISSSSERTNPFPSSKNQGSQWILGCRLFFVTKIRFSVISLGSLRERGNSLSLAAPSCGMRDRGESRTREEGE